MSYCIAFLHPNDKLSNLFIYSRYVSKSCFSYCQASYIDFVLTFRMYVQLGIPEYILISFAVGMYNVVLV